ncbi:hypothetical protein [Clostridium aciditolerans]|uniref:Uncharacterized protein n=1 Tax=Clostridium aciditolerans TaxID=339861 RepID=A0A934HQL3_9CLOT|nr:hypothetical protein [Clostridium aciditolerans]MBI6872510.1 hypothetical protein [Clostridium aciditolerans]
MGISDMKNEVYTFMNKLYNDLKEELYLCGDLKEVNETFDEEYINISDYSKVLQSNLLIRSQSELMDKGYDEDKIKIVEKIEDMIGDIHIAHMKIDENKLYVEEEDKPIATDGKNSEKKSTKTIVVISGILIGFFCGIILKRDIINGIIMGFIGAAFGFAVYEMYFAGDNKNYEKVIRKDRLMNKRLDKKYFDILIAERKRNIESILIKYIDDFNDALEKKVEESA